jgi:hypothetical protein
MPRLLNLKDNARGGSASSGRVFHSFLNYSTTSSILEHTLKAVRRGQKDQGWMIVERSIWIMGGIQEEP